MLAFFSSLPALVMSRTVPSEHDAANTSDVCWRELGNQLTDVTYASNPATYNDVCHRRKTYDETITVPHYK